MIYYERHAFRKGSDYNHTLEPENAYFMVQYNGQGQIAQPLKCAFTDIPGEYLRDERVHVGNIKPHLDQASGLVLVIDGVEANQCRIKDKRLPLLVHYRQALVDNEPIMVIVCL